MINQPENVPFETEQRIRELTAMFVVDAITEPIQSFDGTPQPTDPQAALAYIMLLCGNDPAHFHIVTRAAWADYTVNPDKPRWRCIHDAVRRML